MASIDKIIQDSIDSIVNSSRNPIQNRQREQRGARLKLFVLDLDVGANSGIPQNIKKGEFIEFHYFPSEAKETINQKYDFNGSKAMFRETVSWVGPGSRKINFTAFFNEWGDNLNSIKSTFIGKREGFVSVAESLKFLKQVASPIRVRTGQSETASKPPLVGLIGLSSDEVFVGHLIGLNITITKWISSQNRVSLKDPLGLTQNISVLTDVEVAGGGKIPIRANAELEFVENRSSMQSNSINK